jgi:hypothetical protein
MTNHPKLDEQLREGFACLGVTFHEAQIGFVSRIL